MVVYELLQMPLDPLERFVLLEWKSPGTPIMGLEQTQPIWNLKLKT